MPDPHNTGTEASTTGSVTILLDLLRSDNPRRADGAASDLWARYLSDLLSMARRQLSQRVRQREDEEDVVVDVFDTFCRRWKAGQFELDDRDDLWQLLVRITEHKAANAAKRHTRQRRDIRKEHAAEDADGAASAADDLLERSGPPQPTELEASALVEAAERRLAVLDPSLRQIAIWRLEGFSNAEIAGKDKLDCAERTVERKLNRIREQWSKADGD
jgi:RNA polymerase sigma factor (sigma-70 family)